MKFGVIKSYGAGQGVIKPNDSPRDVFFLDSAVEGGSGSPTEGMKVQYELYLDSQPPEARRVVLM